MQNRNRVFRKPAVPTPVRPAINLDRKPLAQSRLELSPATERSLDCSLAETKCPCHRPEGGEGVPPDEHRVRKLLACCCGKSEGGRQRQVVGFAGDRLTHPGGGRPYLTAEAGAGMFGAGQTSGPVRRGAQKKKQRAVGPVPGGGPVRLRPAHQDLAAGGTYRPCPAPSALSQDKVIGGESVEHGVGYGFGHDLGSPGPDRPILPDCGGLPAPEPTARSHGGRRDHAQTVRVSGSNSSRL